MRKIIIGSIAFLAVVSAFWIYVRVADTVPVNPPTAPVQDDLEIPDMPDSAQRIDGTLIHEVEKSRYVILDPETKAIKQVFGFEKLLNPGAETSRRNVLKPYLIFYEPSYQCRVDSDAGTFQVESAGSSAAPKDAQLSGHVEIHLIPNQGSRLGETEIFLDDLTFSSERSEFATDGPVRIVSEQMSLDGKGLVLIFDTGKGRVEFLHILDLDNLHISSVQPSGSDEPRAATQTASVDTASSRKDEQEEAPSASSPYYYECVLNRNVQIQYGEELIVSGAQRVNIQNILFGGNQQDKDAGRETPRAAQAEAVDGTAPHGGGTAESDIKDVTVRCDGGIILKPMQSPLLNETRAEEAELSVEMSGTPLRIDKVLADSQQITEPLVSCGQLTYTPQEDILRLFTDVSQPQIVLEAQQSRSRIQTRGNVFWDRKKQYANIAGPGTLFLSGSDPTQAPSEIAFDGAMDLLFAEAPSQAAADPAIQTINFTGGINGIFKQDGGYTTSADSARLDFGLENVLSKVYLLGGVLFESIGKGVFRNAASDSATFYFEENKVKTAEMAGGVDFNSDKGMLKSPNVKIHFEADTAGDVQPVSVQAEGDAVLETIPQNLHQLPARFEAQRIDYNLLTGSGLAYGPIRFTFYRSPESNDTSETGEPTPITVTADGNAEFVADPTRTVRQIIFSRNVEVTQNRQKDSGEQSDTLHGDKLTVYLGQVGSERNEIQRMTMTEGKVFAESIASQGDEKRFHSKLYCTSMEYDQVKNEILVQGPGKYEIVNNGLPAGSEEVSSENTLGRSFVATVTGFKTILWDLNTHKIDALQDENPMEISYFPLVDGIIQKQIYLYTQQLEAEYLEEGLVLTRVFTDTGVIFEQYNADKSERLHHISGQSLTYDAAQDEQWLTISGSIEKPVFVNGWRMPQAVVNLQTGEVKTSLSSTPGVIR